MTDENGNSTSTRDMAVETRTLMNSHLIDCAEFRKRIFEKLGAQDKQLKWQTWVLTMIIGVYFTINWLADHPQVISRISGH
jgi:hypothetical protein